VDGQEELEGCKSECEKERLTTYVKSLTSQVGTLPGFVELLCHSPAETTTTSYGDIVDDLLSKYNFTFSFLLLRTFPSVWSTSRSISVSAESMRKPATIDEAPTMKETLLKRLVALKQECFTLQRQLAASEDLRLALQDKRAQKSALAEESQELVVLKQELTSLHAEHAALREQLEQERATRGRLAGELAKLLVPTLRAASTASQQGPANLLDGKKETQRGKIGRLMFGKK
jgi:myosin heavy subunit